jgi:hypothetical protein
MTVKTEHRRCNIARRVIDRLYATVPATADQIVPYADAAPLSAKFVKSGTLKTYEGFPHGIATTEAAMINANLLAFIGGG